MTDHKSALIKAIDISKCKIQFEGPIALICGGPVDVKHEQLSLRNAILKSTAENNDKLHDLLVQAEELTDWLYDSMYSDLVTFEKDLASIASLIIIILESEGSIAELGAFSQTLHLHKKLYVVIVNSYRENDSFINLGILRFIDNNENKSVRVYPPCDIREPRAKIVVEDIHNAVKSLNKTQKIDIKKSKHIIIYEMICLFLALKSSEIMFYLSLLGINIEKDSLKRCTHKTT